MSKKIKVPAPEVCLKCNKYAPHFLARTESPVTA
jgi:hypothetical protein